MYPDQQHTRKGFKRRVFFREENSESYGTKRSAARKPLLTPATAQAAAAGAGAFPRHAPVLRVPEPVLEDG